MLFKLIGRLTTFPTNATDALRVVQMTPGVSDQAPHDGVPEPTHLTGLFVPPLLRELPGSWSFSLQELLRIWFPLLVFV